MLDVRESFNSDVTKSFSGRHPLPNTLGGPSPTITVAKWHSAVHGFREPYPCVASVGCGFVERGKDSGVYLWVDGRNVSIVHLSRYEYDGS